MESAFVGRLVAACVIIGLVLAAVQFVARRALRFGVEGGGGRLVALLETTSLPGAASVHVLRVAERYYVIGRSGSTIAPICEIPGEAVEAHARATAGSRRSHVDRLVRGRMRRSG